MAISGPSASTSPDPLDVSETSTPTSVVVVDDHHAIRSALWMLLDGAPDLTVVGEATSVALTSALRSTRAPTAS